MEGIATMLTDEQQALVGPIPFAGMPTDRASLTRIVGIHLDRHAACQEGFIGYHGMQLGKSPLSGDRIGLSLFLTRPFAMLATSAFADVGQVFQADERMRRGAHESLTHDMVGVLRSPVSLARRSPPNGGWPNECLSSEDASACVRNDWPWAQWICQNERIACPWW